MTDGAPGRPPPAGAEAETYRRVLASMAGGVMSLDRRGRIVTFNRAAGAILGLDPAQVVGRTYAELFFDDPGLDGLNELVLAAIYEQSLTHSREVDVALAGRTMSLSVTTSLLKHREDGDPLGVVVVLDDVTERRERRKLRSVVGEYVDPRVLDRLLASAADLASAAERRVMTVAFCDLVGFTPLAEALDARRLVDFLNAYVGRMTAAVAATEGVTDKLIGDAVMAFWGEPFTAADHAQAACACALMQREALGGLRADGLDLGLPPDAAARLGVRIGIATGEVVAGSIGAAGTRSFTVVGDTVNVAARLEAANKELGTDIAASAATKAAAEAGFAFRPLGSLRLRGRARLEPVYALDGRL